MKFKEGDKVKVVSNEMGLIPIGSVGVVYNVNEDYVYPYAVMFDEDSESFAEDELELYTNELEQFFTYLVNQTDGMRNKQMRDLYNGLAVMYKRFKESDQ